MAKHQIVTPQEIMATRTKSKRRASTRIKDESEDKIQKRFVAWLRAHGFNFFHVPNQLAARSKRHGAILKAMGVQAGVPDIVILDTPENPAFAGYRAICIELKTGTGKVTNSQIEWRDKARHHQWFVGLARGYDQAIGLCRTVWPSCDDRQFSFTSYVKEIRHDFDLELRKIKTNLGDVTIVTDTAAPTSGSNQARGPQAVDCTSRNSTP